MDRQDRDETAAGPDDSARGEEIEQTPAGRMRARRGAGRADVGDDAAGEHHTTSEAERERRERAERFQAEHPELVERGRRTEGERLDEDG